jgi:hypothetical protein
MCIAGGCRQPLGASSTQTPDVLIGKIRTDKVPSELLSRLQSKPVRAAYTEKHYYYSFAQDGIELLCDSHDRIKTVFIFAGDDHYGSYVGELPRNIRLSDSRTEVNRKLGKPSVSGVNAEGIFGNIPMWDKFYLPTYSLHVEYGTNGTLRQITLSMLEGESPNKQFETEFGHECK